MTDEYPFIYICSHAGKIGNLRWVNSDTRWPDEYKPIPGGGFQLGYWGRWGLVEPPVLADDGYPAELGDFVIT